MSDQTRIEWADATWNPIVGCSKVSPGCANCYAEKMAHRLANMKATMNTYAPVVDFEGGYPLWSGRTSFVESQLDKPLRWRKPRRIFVCSMGDLFHESVPDEWLLRVFDVIRECHVGYAPALDRMTTDHLFMVLTKRPERMRDFCSRLRFDGSEGGRGLYLAERANAPGYSPVFRNLMLGVTVENQEQMEIRCRDLQLTPAASRFVSVEPMLGPINFWPRLVPLDLVIVGGETGRNARPMHPDWVRSARDQCVAAGVPFFFKGWGEWTEAHHGDIDATYVQQDGDTFRCPEGEEGRFAPIRSAAAVRRVGKRRSGRVLDGRTWEQMP